MDRPTIVLTMTGKGKNPADEVCVDLFQFEDKAREYCKKYHNPDEFEWTICKLIEEGVDYDTYHNPTEVKNEW